MTIHKSAKGLTRAEMIAELRERLKTAHPLVKDSIFRNIEGYSKRELQRWYRDARVVSDGDVRITRK